jgi:hypothetical protein
MQVRILANSYQRASGAMFRPSLGQEVLVFAYPFAFNRVFTTWFCSPLRILAFDDNGTLSYNAVINRWRLVNLPETRLVLEVDPVYPYQGLIEEIEGFGVDDWVSQYLSNSKQIQGGAGTPVDDPYGELLLSLISDSLEQLRTIKEFLNGARPLRGLKKLPPWRKGQIISAASFVLDVAPVVPYQIPPAAVKLARNLIAHEDKNDQREFLAAALAGLPWEAEAFCFRCGKGGIWRQTLKPSEKIAKVSQWRLARPENHVPLCSNCEEEFSLDDVELGVALAYGYWGCRFEALHRWFKDAKSGKLPGDWDLDDYPLWPEGFGGNTWAQGSGSVRHSAPRFRKALRTREHIQILSDTLKGRNYRPGRLSPNGELYSLLNNPQNNKD